MSVLLPVLSFLLLVSTCAGEDEPVHCEELEELDATTRGELSSPGYKEGKYPDGLSCEYIITAPEGHRIKLTFKDFDVDPSGGCTGDRLLILSKGRKSIILMVCGKEIPNPVISDEDENEIRLLFATDFMVGAKGFLLEYESGPNLSLCKTNEKVCRNRNCFEEDNECDGKDDCGDGTDEEDCGRPVPYPNKNCGVPPITPKTIYDPYMKENDRMYGGEAAIPNSWPWQVSIQWNFIEPNGHYCGGTLISPEWVVTAAHCFADAPSPFSVRIVLGSHNKYTKTKYQQYRVAEIIVSYPDLEGEQLKNWNITDDIALIKLNAPVTLNDGVQPACLPGHHWETNTNWVCYATGWGETRGTGFADVLKQAQQNVLAHENCTHNVQTQICVYKEGKSPCNGDSGGPLVCKLAHQWYVMGVTSYAKDDNLISDLCGIPDVPDIFSKVADKSPWIHQMISKYD